MKIVFIENIDPYIDSSGGIAVYLKNLVIYLKKRSIHTTLVGASPIPSLPQDNGRSLEIPVDRFITIARKKLSHPIYILRLLLKAPRMSFENHIIFHGQRPDVLFPLLLFKPKYTFICSLHGAHIKAVYHKKGKFRGFIYSLLERYAFKKAHTLIAVDEGTGSYYRSRYSHSKNKIITIPIGINFEKFHPINNKGTLRTKYGLKNAEKIILYIGRLEKEKNLYFLIDVFFRVKREFPQSKLLLIGTGREELNLKEYVRSRALEGVTFLGTVANNQVPELMNCADVFTLCSLYEGSPTVIKEALACNIPVVSFDVGDVKSIIQDLPDCFIARNNQEDFAARVMQVLNSPSNNNYRDVLRQYDNQIVFAAVEALYSRLSKNIPPPSFSKKNK